MLISEFFLGGCFAPLVFLFSLVFLLEWSLVEHGVSTKVRGWVSGSQSGLWPSLGSPGVLGANVAPGNLVAGMASDGTEVFHWNCGLGNLVLVWPLV